MILRSYCSFVAPVLAIVLSLTLSPRAPGQCQTAKLLPSDGAAGESFGGSVSVSGDVALVGAHNDDDLGSESGSAYIYRFNGLTWVQEQKLLAGDGAPNEDFGRSVAVCGVVAVVGAVFDDDLGQNSGSAYIYRFNGSSWVQEQKLLASDGSEFDNFGMSVAVSGDLALIGASADDDLGRSSGSVYIYRFNGSSWSQKQKLLADDGAAFDYFGGRMAVDGDVVVIGADFDDDHGNNSGSAYIFRFNGSTWVQEQKLLASDGAAGDRFGLGVALSGDVAVVGARFNDEIGTDSGSAYIFRFDGGSWVQEQKLLASDGAAGDRFGVSVAVTGDMAVVGAFRDDDLDNDSGSAYVYRFNGTTWVQEQKLQAADGAAKDGFGFSVSVSGDVAVVGAKHDDDLGSDSGSAYVFNVSNACPADSDCSGEVNVMDLLNLLMAWGPCAAPCSLDTNDDGNVNVIDLLALLVAWGACP